MTTFGKRLKRKIEEEGLTQAKFAKDCYLSPVTVSQYVNDVVTPTLATLCYILEHYGWSADELLFGDKYRGW